jgi:alpha-glucosidase
VHRLPDGRTSAVQPPDGLPKWWRTAVFYEVYVRSFYDSNADGVGDLDGLRQRLDYLRMLGVDALWLTPFYQSPMADHGYDVADPRAVDPLFGDLAAFDALVRAGHERGLRLTVDLVPNHTSDQHPWFREAVAAGPGTAARGRYYFRDGKGPGGAAPPNNWMSVFGGSAWSRVPDGQWYLHLFAPEQPDLNWADPAVLADLETTMRFWLDRGVDGFRIDVAHGMAKPEGLPDMRLPEGNEVLLYADEHDPRFDVDGVHELHRSIRRVLDSYRGRMAVGEVWVTDDDRLAQYVRPDELNLAFNFQLLEAPWGADSFRRAIEQSMRAMAAVAAPATWVLSNHDRDRHVTRYGGGEVGLRRGRAAALMQLALPGAAFLYYGDELGLPNVELPDEALQDPWWERSGRTERGRDGERIPMPWGGEKSPYDFTTGPTTWLPMPDGWADLTVEAQLDDPRSMLSLYRKALQLRREHPAFAEDGLEWVTVPDDCVAFRRSGGLLCVLNASSAEIAVPAGDVLLSSGPLSNGRLPPDTAVWLA